MSETPGAPAPQSNPQPAPAVDPRDKEIADLKAKLEETSKGWEKDRDTLQKANFILETATADPNITKQLKAAIEKKIQAQENPEPSTPPAPETPPEPQNPNPMPQQQPQNQPPITEESALLRENIIKNVENAYGMQDMTDDQRKELRKKVAQRLANYGMDVTKVPLSQLESVLKDQYLLENVGKATEEGRMKGLIEAHNNSYGAIPNMSTQQPQNETVTVTQDQKKWADKLGVGLDKVEANLKELEETGKVTYKPKEVQPQAQPAPSGNPQYTQ